MSISRAYDLWEWIRRVELTFGVNMQPIPDVYCATLINKLQGILPELKVNCIPKYESILNDDLILNFENKLYKEEENRSMLFDFIKNLVHEVLLKDMVKDGE